MGIGHLSLLYKSVKNNLGLSLVDVRVFPVSFFSPNANPILGTNGGMNTLGVGGLHYRYIDPEGQSTGSWNFGAFVNFQKTRYTEYTTHIFHTTRSTSTNIIIRRMYKPIHG